MNSKGYKIIANRPKAPPPEQGRLITFEILDNGKRVTIDTNDYKGIYIKVYGNEKDYSIHLRTGLTFAPWQYYSYTFAIKKNWSEIRAPFEQFKKSNFYQPKSIIGQNIKSVGLVAGFDDFKSDICLSEIGFY